MQEEKGMSAISRQIERSILTGSMYLRIIY